MLGTFFGFFWSKLFPSKPKGPFWDDNNSPSPVAYALMYSAICRSFFMVTAYDNGQKRVDRVYGKADAQMFVLALKHNEPIFIQDGKPTEEEMKLIALLYDT